MNLKNKKALVWDRGLYTYLAQKLGESFGEVWYYLPQSDPYPKSPTAQIGVGLAELTRVYDFWKYVDLADVIVFFDCYDGKLQQYLREKGYRVFGSGLSEKIELDKVLFLQTLEEVGLPVPHTYRAEGVDDLLQYLEKSKGEKWLKASYYRGDFETKKYRGMAHLEPWLDDLRKRIGQRIKDIEILVQDPIESVCEIGYDGFCIDGQFTENSMSGYEIKDKGLIARVHKETPPILAYVNGKMSPVFKKYGYRGHYSSEIRITSKGVPYFIDPTCRAPSPPSELLCELYENYAEVVWLISNGEVPVLKPKAVFGAELILSSPWHEQNELCVEIPKELISNVKLKNHTKRGNVFYCIPNDNHGIFGAVITHGKSVKDVTSKILDIAKELKVDELDYETSTFTEAEKECCSGEKFGISYK